MNRALIAFATVIALTACSHSPVAREHSLFPPLDSAVDSVAAETGAATTSVVVVSCTVPEIIDRPQWVVLDAWGEVQILPSERWIEPLKHAIPRVIAHEIQRALPQVAAWSAAGAGTARADIRIRLDVAAWQASRGREARVDLVWRIDRGNDTRLERGSFVAPVEDNTPAGLLRAQREALAHASKKITGTVQSLLRESPR